MIPQEDVDLRDRFAAEALAALISKAPFFDRENQHGKLTTVTELRQFKHDMAMSAYDYADAMIWARQQ